MSFYKNLVNKGYENSQIQNYRAVAKQKMTQPYEGSGLPKRLPEEASNRPQRDINKRAVQAIRNEKFEKLMKHAETVEHTGYGKMVASLVAIHGSVENIPEHMKRLLTKMRTKKID